MSDRDLLLRYCRKCDEEGVINNSSPKRLKLGVFENEKWWAVFDLDKNEIISLSGVYPITELGKDVWRVMFRLATLESYRGKAGPISKFQKSCFGWGRMLPLQVAYCKSMGAKEIVFTTNLKGGTDGSRKQDRICDLVFEKLNMARKMKTQELYYTTQNIWQVLIKDVYSMKSWKD